MTKPHEDRERGISSGTYGLASPKARSFRAVRSAPFFYLGDSPRKFGNREEPRLYDDRRGLRCRIVGVNEGEAYPLSIRFDVDGFVGIAERSSLRREVTT